MKGSALQLGAVEAFRELSESSLLLLVRRRLIRVRVCSAKEASEQAPYRREAHSCFPRCLSSVSCPLALSFSPVLAKRSDRFDSLTPGPGYLEALVEPNVDFISNPIKRITETGIETADGNHREYDTIVTATGFDTSYRPRIPISESSNPSYNLMSSRADLFLPSSLVGRNGSNVQDLWDNIPRHYLSMAIGPDHPNFVSEVNSFDVSERLNNRVLS